MSYDQLAQHARDIEAAAVEAEYQQQLRASNPPGYQNINTGTPPPDRSAIAAKYHNTVQPLFEPFTRMPDPRAYDAPIAGIRSAMANLSHGSSGSLIDPSSNSPIPSNPRMHWIEAAADVLADWKGVGASNFKTNFLGRFGDVSTNQFLVLGVVKGGLEAEQAVWEKAQNDIDTIAHETLNGLEDLNSCSQSEVSFALQVVGTVVAIGAIPFTGGVSAMVVGAVGAATMLGQTANKAAHFTGGGSTVEQVIQSLQSGIDRLTGEIQVQRNDIARAMHDYAGAVQRHTGSDDGSSPFVSPRPNLASMHGQKLISRHGVGNYT